MLKEKTNEFIQKEKVELPEEDMNVFTGGGSAPDIKQDEPKEKESPIKPLFF